MSDNPTNTGLAGHGAGRLSAVHIDTYNAELRDADGFIGDRASGRAFRAILQDVRERASQGEDDDDPLGETHSRDISKKKLDRLLASGDPEAAGVLIGTIEEFAQEFATVIHRITRLPEWQDTQCIVVGGGLRDSRVGELAIGRTAVILKGSGMAIQLRPICHHPDEAGLIGCLHLAPAWMFSGHDAILAVDIGGSNIRAGLVASSARKAPNLSKAAVVAFDLWRYAEEDTDRDNAVARLASMLRTQIARADKDGLTLAPFIGIGCPGLIRDDGSIAKGGQNLPGDWEHENFNLPQRLRDAIPVIDGHETVVLMHNDAVVQGLSEVPFMRDTARWGVMTIGTGLGNARFTTRRADGG